MCHATLDAVLAADWGRDAVRGGGCRCRCRHSQRVFDLAGELGAAAVLAGVVADDDVEVGVSAKSFSTDTVACLPPKMTVSSPSRSSAVSLLPMPLYGQKRLVLTFSNLA
jgi:hypothetical protein